VARLWLGAAELQLVVLAGQIERDDVAAGPRVEEEEEDLFAYWTASGSPTKQHGHATPSFLLGTGRDHAIPM
jgi:hypothetical protein